MANSQASEESFYIKTITEQDSERTIAFLKQFFYTDEPLNAYLDRERKERIDFSNKESLTQSISEGLSVMVVTSSNEIIGACLNKKYTAHLVTQNANTKEHPNSIEIWKLIDMLENKVGDRIKLSSENEKELYVRIISVHPDWRGKRIGSMLLEETRNIAQRNKFSQIRVNCTSAFSANLFAKMGYQCVDAIKYEDYKEGGKVVFKPDPPHIQIKVMLLRI